MLASKYLHRIIYIESVYVHFLCTAEKWLHCIIIRCFQFNGRWLYNTSIALAIFIFNFGYTIILTSHKTATFNHIETSFDFFTYIYVYIYVFVKSAYTHLLCVRWADQIGLTKMIKRV